MNLKVGLSLLEKCGKYAKVCGKEHILQTVPQKLSKINSNELKLCTKSSNIKGLEYTSGAKSDTFVKKVETWLDPMGHITPYAKEGETEVLGHHRFYDFNDYSNRNLEDEIMMLKEKYPNITPEHLKKCTEGRQRSIAETHILDINGNRNFLELTPQPHASTAYRGTSQRIDRKTVGTDIDIIEKAKVGDEIVPTGGCPYAAHHKFGAYQYMGSPYDKFGNIKFKPMLIEYKIPKGAQVSVNMEHDGEVVFPALSKYKLLSKETRYIQQLDYMTGVPIGSYPYTHVVLEYIPEIPTFSKYLCGFTDAEYKLLESKAKECKNFAEFADIPKKFNL